jgi:uncharacterized protein YdaU (DUF1376 family)
LPDNEKALAKLANFDREDFAAAWPIVQKCFSLIDGRYHHGKVDQKRPACLASANQRKEKAKKAAEAKWKGHEKQSENAPSNAQAMLQAMPGASSKQCSSNAQSMPILHASSFMLQERLYPAIGTVSVKGPRQQEKTKIDSQTLADIGELLEYWTTDATGRKRLGSPDGETVARIASIWPGTFDEFGAALKARCLDTKPESIKTWGWFVNVTKSLSEAYLADTG